METFRALLTPIKIFSSWLLAAAIIASVYGDQSHAMTVRARPTLHAPEVVIEVLPLGR